MRQGVGRCVLAPEDLEDSSGRRQIILPTGGGASGTRDPASPQFTDHYFTGDYPTRLLDREVAEGRHMAPALLQVSERLTGDNPDFAHALEILRGLVALYDTVMPQGFVVVCSVYVARCCAGFPRSEAALLGALAACSSQ